MANDVWAFVQRCWDPNPQRRPHAVTFPFPLVYDNNRRQGATGTTTGLKDTEWDNNVKFTLGPDTLASSIEDFHDTLAWIADGTFLLP